MHTCRRRAPLAPFIAALSVLLATPLTLAHGFEPFERWYVIQIDGERAGWALERHELDADGNIRSLSEQEISIRRMGQEITIKIASEFVETIDHEPVSMSSIQETGIFTQDDRFEFTGEMVLHTTKQAGRETTKQFDAPEFEWLTPLAAREYVEGELARGAEEIVFTTLAPSSGLNEMTQTMTIVGPTNVEVLGKTVPAIEWKLSQSVLPGVVSTEYVSTDGETLRSEFGFGGISMVMLASEKELALAELDAPELMAETLVRPNRPIENPRSTRRSQFIVRMADGSDLPEFLNDGAQRAESIDASSARIAIDADNLIPADPNDAEDPRFLEATPAADADDPEIIALVDRALADAGESPAERAETLRRFVHEYINAKSLGVGFATASEVCRTREGDCSEHGVLLAAMLRAAGIPSRVVSGVIYVDMFAGGRQVFGYHMWTQGLIEIDGDHRWVDLDATLPASTPYDAAHIAISTSSLAQGDVLNSMAALVNLLGVLEIDVVEIE